MDPRSATATIGRLRSVHSPSHGRNKRNEELQNDLWHPCDTARGRVRIGDQAEQDRGEKQASQIDPVAEQTAAATLPLAIEISAIDDCTVEGKTQTNSTPDQSN